MSKLMTLFRPQPSTLTAITELAPIVAATGSIVRVISDHIIASNTQKNDHLRTQIDATIKLQTARYNYELEKEKLELLRLALQKADSGTIPVIMEALVQTCGDGNNVERKLSR